MDIVFYCMNAACPNRLRVDEQFIGKEVRCPTCAHVSVVPNVSAPESPVIPAVLVEQEVVPAPVLLFPAPAVPWENQPPEQDLPLAPTLPPPVLACPSCFAALPVAAVLCIACGLNLRTGEKLVTERGHAADAPPRPRKKKGLKREQYRLTNLGLGFHYARVLGVLVAIVLGIVGFLLLSLLGVSAAAGERQTAGTLATILRVLVVLPIVGCLTVAPLLGVTGSILCCRVPPKTGARSFMIASLAVDASGMVLGLLALLGAGLPALGNLGSGVRLVANGALLLATLCGPVAFVLFLLFLGRLGSYLQDEVLRDEAMEIVIHVALLAGASFAVAILGCVVIVLVPAVGPMLAYAGLVILILFLAKLMLRTLHLIGTLRQLVRTRGG